MTDIIKKIKKLGIRVEEDVDLSKYTTYKTGGIVKVLLTLKSEYPGSA